MVTEIGHQAAVKLLAGSTGGSVPRRAEGAENAAATKAVAEALPVDGKNLPPAADETAKPEQLRELVSNLNELVQNVRRELQFSVDDDTGRTVIRVINRDTDEVIRQIPPEELLQITRNFTGTEALLISTKV